jgi:uncharacterized membrane-anchored protein
MSRRSAGFGLALLAQVVLLAAVPWPWGDDELTAHTIWLQTTASDQHHVLQGEYLNLDYEIADPSHFDFRDELRSGEAVYAVVREIRPGIWSGLRLDHQLPSDLPADQVAIRGEIVDRSLNIRAFLHEKEDGTWTADSVVVTADLWSAPEPDEREDRAVASAYIRRQRIAYRDIETYFVPESERKPIEEDLHAHPKEVAAQVRVSETGRASLMQIRIQDRTYDF